MSTPNKDNVVDRMEALIKALSERDVESLVGMAQEEEEPPKPEKERK